METIEKEQQEPAFIARQKNKKKPIVVLAVVLIILIGLFYIFTQTSIFSSDPYAVQLNGTTILPGETTVQELADAGYQLTDFTAYKKQAYDITDKADPKTNYTMIDLMKDGKVYANIEVMNQGSDKIPLSECIVSNVHFTKTSEYTDSDKIVFNTAARNDVTVDKMTAISGKPAETKEYSPTDEKYKGTEYIWSSGFYHMHVVVLKDGTVYQISSTYEL